MAFQRLRSLESLHLGATHAPGVVLWLGLDALLLVVVGFLLVVKVRKTTDPDDRDGRRSARGVDPRATETCARSFVRRKY